MTVVQAFMPHQCVSCTYTSLFLFTSCLKLYSIWSYRLISPDPLLWAPVCLGPLPRPSLWHPLPPTTQNPFPFYSLPLPRVKKDTYENERCEESKEKHFKDKDIIHKNHSFNLSLNILGSISILSGINEDALLAARNKGEISVFCRKKTTAVYLENEISVK